MIYFHGTTDFQMACPTAVTLGKFDGIHRGHQKLLRQILSRQEKGEQSVAFILNARKGSLLLTDEEQREFLERFGLDCVVRCPFIPEISGMSPAEFIDEILIRRLHAGSVTVGTDFRFGYRRAGDAEFLRSYGAGKGLEVFVLEKELYNGREISSTYIREALSQGDMELARELLGRPYSVNGTIIHGRAFGRTLGMPTANLVAADEKLLPPNGVYFSQMRTGEKVRNSITNIGYKPTVGGTFRGVETYLYDTNENLYGEQAVVSLLHFKRKEVRFDSIEALKQQIASDIEAGRTYFE